MTIGQESGRAWSDPASRKAWIAGGGIGGLAAATYLIREGGFTGSAITILSDDPRPGGALDGAGSNEAGYLIRGGRMFEEHFGCTWDLLSQVPSLHDPAVSVTAEAQAFNHRVVSAANARLLRAGRKVDVGSYGLDTRDLLALLRLMFSHEETLTGKRIDAWFAPAFFNSVFWLLWRSTFAFQPWSSLGEFRRYALRFLHLLPGMHRLEGIMRTPLNQYDSIVRPLESWLHAQGVRLLTKAAVTDVAFDITSGHKTATALEYTHGGRTERIALAAGDLLFVTLGSIVENASVGDMHNPALLEGERADGAWALWRRIAAHHPDFGRPEVFCGDVARSKWMSFTVTQHTPAFFAHMERFTGNRAGTGGLVTLTDSNWFMSVVLAHQPHFAGQADDVFVFWGNGLEPDRPGNFVARPMSACSGREILIELFSHLGIIGEMLPLLDQMNCRPCLMPYIDSEFMPRQTGDRPAVVPSGATNFAFLGQFVEQPEDCVFTVEYSVRSAQAGVFTLLGSTREPTPVYHGAHDIGVLIDALTALRR